MQTDTPKDDIKLSLYISLKCALALAVVSALIYLFSTSYGEIFAGISSGWDTLVKAWDFLMIPFRAVFHYVADLPIALSAGLLIVVLWSACVKKKLEKQGLTGSFYRVFRKILYISLITLFLVFGFKCISVMGFWTFVLFSFLLAFISTFIWSLIAEFSGEPITEGVADHGSDVVQEQD